MRWSLVSVNACVAMICGSCFSRAVAQSDSSSGVEKAFENKYEHWRRYLEESRIQPPGSSYIGPEFFENDAFKQILGLGPAALPYIIEKADGSDAALIEAAYSILKLRLEMKREGKKPGEYVWYIEGFP